MKMSINQLISILLAFQIGAEAVLSTASPIPKAGPRSSCSTEMSFQAIPPVLSDFLHPILFAPGWRQKGWAHAALKFARYAADHKEHVVIGGAVAFLASLASGHSQAVHGLPLLGFVGMVGVPSDLTEDSSAFNPATHFSVSGPSFSAYMKSAEARELAKRLRELAGDPDSIGKVTALTLGEKQLTLEVRRSGRQLLWTIERSMENLRLATEIVGLRSIQLRSAQQARPYNKIARGATEKRLREPVEETFPGVVNYVRTFVARGELSLAAQSLSPGSLRAGDRGELAFGNLSGQPIGLATSPFPKGSLVSVLPIAFDPAWPDLGMFLKLTSVDSPETIDLRPTAAEGYWEPFPTTSEQALWGYTRDFLAGGHRGLGAWMFREKFGGTFDFTLTQKEKWILPFALGHLPSFHLKGVPTGTHFQLRAIPIGPGSSEDEFKIELQSGPDRWHFTFEDAYDVFRGGRVSWEERKLLQLDPRMADYLEAYLHERPLAPAARRLPKVFEVRAGEKGMVHFGVGRAGELRWPNSTFRPAERITVTPVFWDLGRPELGVYFRLNSDLHQVDLELSPVGGFIRPLPTDAPAAVSRYLESRSLGRDLSLDTWRLLTHFPSFDIKLTRDRCWFLPLVPNTRKRPKVILRDASESAVIHIRPRPVHPTDLRAGVVLEASSGELRWTLWIKPFGNFFKIVPEGPGPELLRDYCDTLRTQKHSTRRDHLLARQASWLQPYERRVRDGSVELFRRSDGFSLQVPLEGVPEGEIIRVIPVVTLGKSRSDVVLRLKTDRMEWTVRVNQNGESAALHVFEPSLHVSLTMDGLLPFVEGTKKSKAQVIALLAKVRAQIVEGTERGPIPLGTRVVLTAGDRSVVATMRKFERQQEWSLDRSHQMFSDLLEIVGDQGLVQRAENPPRPFHPLLEVAVIRNGFWARGLRGEDAKRVAEELGVPPRMDVSRKFEGSSPDMDFEVFTRSRGPNVVWAFRWEDREKVATHFGFHLPPEATEELLNIENLSRYSDNLSVLRSLMASLGRRLGKMTSVYKGPVWIGEAGSLIRVSQRWAGREVLRFVEAAKISMVPRAVGYQKPVQFHEPAQKVQWVRHPFPQFNPEFEAYLESVILEKDLVAAAEKVLEREVYVSSEGEIVLGAWKGRAAILPKSPFARGSRVKVIPQWWDVDHPDLGLFFRLESDTHSLDVFLNDTVTIVEPVPESGAAALRIYLRDLLTGRDLTLSSWILLNRFQEFVITLATQSQRFFGAFADRSSMLRFQSAPAGGEIKVRSVAIDPNDLRLGVKLEATHAEESRTFSMLRRGNVFRGRPHGSVRPYAPGIRALMHYLQASRSTESREPHALETATAALEPFERKALDGRVHLFNLGEEGVQMKLEGVREGEKVTYSPIVDRNHLSQGAFYLVQYGSSIEFAHPVARKPYLETFENGALVKHAGRLWVKEQAVTRTVHGELMAGYILRDPIGDSQVTAWLVRPDVVRRASPEEVLQFARSAELSASPVLEGQFNRWLDRHSTKKAERYLNWLLKKFLIPERRERLIRRFGSDYQFEDRQAMGENPLGQMLSSWLRVSRGSVSREVLDVVGQVLEHYARRLFRAEDVHLLLLANGPTLSGVRQKALAFHLYVLKLPPHRKPSKARLRLLRIAARSLFSAMGISTSIRVSERPMLFEGEPSLYGQDYFALFRPVLFGNSLLVEAARVSVLYRMLKRGNRLRKWETIQKAVRAIRRNGDFLPSLEVMASIFHLRYPKRRIAEAA